MDINKDYYKILDVSKKASVEEIKKAYRKKANLTHPDKNNGNDSEFKFVNEAYQILGSTKRKEYDLRSPHGNNYNPSLFGGSGFGAPFGFEFDFGGGGSFFDSIFSDFFGGGGYKENLDINFNGNISLSDIYNNKKLTIKYNRNISCKSCRGTGFDRNSHSEKCDICDGSGKNKYGMTCKYCIGEGKIYTGQCSICNGEKITSEEKAIEINDIYTIRKSIQSVYRNLGHQSKYYRDKIGKLILNLNLNIDKKYKIINNVDLQLDINVHFQDAINGDYFIINNLDGKILKIKIPEKSNDGDIIRVKNKGLLKNLTDRGDLYIKINIIIDYNKLE